MGHAHGLVASHPADPAAFLVHAQKQGRFGVGLGVGEHGDGLLPIHQIGGKVADAAHRLLGQSRPGGVAGLGGQVHAGEGLGSGNKELPDLFLLGHGSQIRLDLCGEVAGVGGRFFRIVRRLGIGGLGLRFRFRFFRRFGRLRRGFLRFTDEALIGGQSSGRILGSLGHGAEEEESRKCQKPQGQHYENDADDNTHGAHGYYLLVAASFWSGGVSSSETSGGSSGSGSGWGSGSGCGSGSGSTVVAGGSGSQAG